MIIGIVACDEKFGIGKTNTNTGKGELLFKLKKDMEFFQSKTKRAGLVIFGENTYLSLPKRPLPDRVNIVLCPEGHKYDGCLCFHNFEQLLEFCKIMGAIFDICICGGGQLYNAFLPYYDKVYMTKVKASGDAEVFFPNLDEHSEFKLISRSQDIYDNGYIINFCTYMREINE